jgi:hypothetical protein
MLDKQKTWKVDSIWVHTHDVRLQIAGGIGKRGVVRYMVAVSKGSDVRVHTIYATDELDAFKKYKETK